jgi:hypothetical protein
MEEQVAMPRAGLLLLAFLAALTLTSSALGASPDVRLLKPGQHIPLKAEPGSLVVAPQAGARRAAPSAAAADATPPIGTQRVWLALDDGDGTPANTGGAYLKTYTLRGVGDKIEVWVADELTFEDGDCRNDARIEIGDAQVQYLIQQFDTNMYPKESAAFSVPPSRNGSNALLDDLLDDPDTDEPGCRRTTGPATATRS